MNQYERNARTTNTFNTMSTVSFLLIEFFLIANVHPQSDFVFPDQVKWQTEPNEEDSCTTPAGMTGTCIPIKTCKFIVDTLTKAPRPLPPATVQLLQSHHCGFESAGPKVCCPANTKPHIDDRNTFEPPDVSRHRNRGLINGKNCGPLTGDRIFGGNKTEPFEFPWMALIAFNTRSGLGFRCGGTLINENYILTAAHCITNLEGNTLAGVRLGEHDISKDEDCNSMAPEDCAPAVQDYTISEIIPHPQYDPVKLVNDIGLLRLSGPANFGPESVRPICLPTGELKKESLVGKNVIVAGWGATETGYASADLLKVALPVISNEECQRRYNLTRTTIRIGPQQLCAGGISGKDSCSGDSGGPLKFISQFNNDPRVVQYGVVSFGPKFCGNANQPGVYTKVAYYMDWILDNMRR